MTNIDQFESVFKAADKAVFAHESVEIDSLLVIADGSLAECEQFASRVQDFLRPLSQRESLRWSSIHGDEFSRVGQLLQLVGEANPELICTYRNLHTPATEYPYSLGTYVDVLTQVSTIPVLLLPHPQLTGESDPLTGTRSVMAITDHLTGDHHLVSYAAALTEPGGKLYLTHVEDEATFQRYVETIGKIPTIDTESARHEILDQLLKEPRDYIASCREVLRSEALPIELEEIVALGHRLADYRRLIDEHDVDLLVLNTKDDDQLAMHGLAYPLSVELRNTPMLLL